MAHFQGFRLLPPDLATAIATSRSHCPFCPGRVLRVTPTLAEPEVPGGRIRQGEAALFPNLSPYDRHSVVVALTRRHYVAADRFSSAQILDGLGATLRYFELLPRRSRGSYSVLTWNYMPPAGATQVHPHFQAFATDRPGWLLEEEVRCSRVYHRRHRRPYWETLLAAERQAGERLVAEGEHTSWVTPFVARGVISDVMTLFPGRARLEEVSGAAWKEFAEGLRAALRLFHREGVRAFNLALYEAPSGEPRPHFWVHARVSPRLYFSPEVSGSDSTAWQHLLDEPFMVRSPEALAAYLRPGLGAALRRASPPRA
ncbi:MAG: hypothetical protein ACRENV_07500 [Candidatus Dormibacteria bacterium]